MLRDFESEKAELGEREDVDEDADSTRGRGGRGRTDQERSKDATGQRRGTKREGE